MQKKKKILKILVIKDTRPIEKKKKTKIVPKDYTRKHKFTP